MKKLIALSGLAAFATPANALSLVSLHGAPVSLTTASTNLALVALGISTLIAVVAYRLVKS